MVIIVINNEGLIKKFTRRSVGGCTRGGNKIIPYLKKEGKSIKIQKIGRSNSAIIDIKKSYDIFLNLYRSDNSFFRCENKNCKDCYGSRAYNDFYILFWIRYIINNLWNLK